MRDGLSAGTAAPDYAYAPSGLQAGAGCHIPGGMSAYFLGAAGVY
jgi:hypothetical protein